MNAFDTRLLNNLFPDMPASFETGVHKALKKAGVKPKTDRPFWIAATAIAATAAAASLLLVLTSAFRGNRHNEVAPGPSAQATALPRASSQPDWQWNTGIFAADLQDSRYTQEDAERCGRCILSFLHEIGESEPDELWIIRMKSTESFLPQDDTGNDRSCVLVLAQSRFGESDGPDLYCIQGHADGEVLWGTIDGAPGPHRVLAEAYGQQRWMVFGTNTESNGTPIGHIKAGYLTGGEPGTDVEFGALLTTEESRKPFVNSKHLDRLTEYYLVTDGASDPSSILNRTLLLVTSQASYTFPIRDNVPELQALTAEEAAAIRKDLDALTRPRPTPTPVAGTTVTNLCNLGDGEIQRYADAVLAWLKAGGTEPQTLWLCGYAPFSFSEEEPTDEAYLLAQYEFEGETGPELFLCKDGTILWQTTGYDPYAINTVYDPIEDQNCVFGASPYYDNGPVPVKEVKLSLSSGSGTVHWASQDGISFAMELPLETVLSRLGGQQRSSAREYFLCPYPKNMTITGITFIAQNGDSYSPAVDTVNRLAAKNVPGPADP